MRHTEDNIQIGAVKWFKLQYPHIVIHHSPNGGKRTSFEAMQFKRMGTQAGFPDLFIMFPNNGFHGLFIEMKTSNGRQTVLQKAFEQKATESGYLYALCRSVDEFTDIIKSYLQ